MDTLVKIRARAACVILASSVLLVGCGEDGWATRVFNPAEPDTLEPEEGYQPPEVETRPMVDQVTQLRVAPTATGVIVHAVGLARDVGYWDSALVAVPDPEQPDVFRLEFLARPPVTLPTTAQPTNARQIKAATYVSNFDLGEARSIVVVGQTASQRVARR